MAYVWKTFFVGYVTGDGSGAVFGTMTDEQSLLKSEARDLCLLVNTERKSGAGSTTADISSESWPDGMPPVLSSILKKAKRRSSATFAGSVKRSGLRTKSSLSLQSRHYDIYSHNITTSTVTRLRLIGEVFHQGIKLAVTIFTLVCRSLMRGSLLCLPYPWVLPFWRRTFLTTSHDNAPDGI